MKLSIIYPERRTIDEDKAIGWAHDGMVNDAVDAYVKAHGLLPDGDEGDQLFALIAAAVTRPSLIEAVEYLDDVGTVTFTREAHEAARSWNG